MKSDAEYKVPNSINFEIIRHLMENAYKWESIESADNMLSRYIAQKGNSAVTQKPCIFTIWSAITLNRETVDVPKNNSYRNLVILTTEVHRLITATNEDAIRKYLSFVNPNEKQLEKINKFRKHAGFEPI